MTYQCFELDIKDHIAHLVLCRPEKRNSMIPAFWDELPAAINEIEESGEARVVVISSTGPHFSSGMDTAVFAGSNSDNEDPIKQARLKGIRFHQNVKRLQQTFTCLEQCRIPVLAAIQGGAIGAGVDLTTACDMRYATEDAFLCIYEINIGMTADVGTYPRITNLLPEGIVKELAYTGRRMPAVEAEKHGIVNSVYPDQATMLAAVMDIAREIARKAPLAVYGSKKIINYSRDHTTDDALDYIVTWNASMLQSDEIQEAMKAAKEKRDGEFVDLPVATRKTKASIND